MVDPSLRSLRYLLFKARREPLRHLPLAGFSVYCAPSMFAPSITGRVHVNPQHAGSCSPDHPSSPIAAANTQELRGDFPGEVYEGGFRLNTPQMIRIKRIFFCKRKCAAHDERSFCSKSDLRPLTSTERGPESVRGFTLPKLRDPESVRGFTLIELLIVVGIIGLLLVLMAPAFTSIKGGTDVTSASYSIKGVLDTARTYAKANNTYTWVGFFEENVSQSSTNPATAGTGRVVMSIVASKDGTTVYNSNSTSIDPTKLIQVGKLVKIDNVHLPILSPGSNTGDTFATRPWPSPTPTPANDSRFGELNLSGAAAAPTTNTQYPFQYPVGSPAPSAQYTFQKTLQFNPRGESSINSGLGVGGVPYNIKPIVEIGLIQTHGTVVPTPTPSAGNYVGNVAAIQITGYGGSVKIYQR
jgi:prepilin-type N-terminal cleavage/methylation domain-containing protein